VRLQKASTFFLKEQPVTNLISHQSNPRNKSNHFSVQYSLYFYLNKFIVKPAVLVFGHQTLKMESDILSSLKGNAFILAFLL
jgi:hypothetical protein